jgi:aminoglycoside phosphotransferase (APT) family kinase protein
MPDPTGRNELLADSSWRPDAEALTAGLRRWVTAAFPAECRLVKAAYPDEGGSSFNLMFDVAEGGNAGGGNAAHYVARLASPGPGYQTFPDESLSRQVRYLQVVRANSDVPVPEVSFYESDGRWLGAPFFVMPRYRGRAWPSDPPYNFGGWVLDLPAEERARMQDVLVSVIAGIHSVRADRCDLSEFSRPWLGSSPLAGQVNYVRELYDWARGARRYPLLEQALDWLRGHVPGRSDPPCVNWGDARAGNLLFADGEVSAVLDWEGACLGYPEVDIAFVWLMHRYYQQRAEAQGIAGLPELFRAEDLAERYASLTGQPLADLHWFQVLGAARAAAIQVRFVSRARAGGHEGAHQDRATPAATPDEALGIRPVLAELLRQ